MDNTLTSEDIFILLRGLKASFQTWQDYKQSIESEKDLDDPERLGTKAWSMQLTWAAQWRQSLELQLKSLRRMVCAMTGMPYDDTVNWSLDHMISLMGARYESSFARSVTHPVAGAEGHTVIR
jgi:hypothetical protein